MLAFMANQRRRAMRDSHPGFWLMSWALALRCVRANSCSERELMPPPSRAASAAGCAPPRPIAFLSDYQTLNSSVAPMFGGFWRWSCRYTRSSNVPALLLFMALTNNAFDPFCDRVRSTTAQPHSRGFGVSPPVSRPGHQIQSDDGGRRLPVSGRRCRRRLSPGQSARLRQRR